MVYKIGWITHCYVTHYLAYIALNYKTMHFVKCEQCTWYIANSFICSQFMPLLHILFDLRWCVGAQEVGVHIHFHKNSRVLSLTFFIHYPTLYLVWLRFPCIDQCNSFFHGHACSIKTTPNMCMFRAHPFINNLYCWFHMLKFTLPMQEKTIIDYSHFAIIL